MYLIKNERRKIVLKKTVTDGITMLKGRLTATNR